MTLAVIGQIARDLVLRCDALPSKGGSTQILERRELLGGKGANQAVALVQLGVPTALVGVVGGDAAGTAVLHQATEDGIDVSGVTRRGCTALLIDLVARVVADGHPDADIADELLRSVQVLRADAKEAELFAGEPVTGLAAARALARRLLARGPDLVALAIPDAGDLVAWRDGSHLFALPDVPVVDLTGAGDSFVAGLIARCGAVPNPYRPVASRRRRRPSPCSALAVGPTFVRCAGNRAQITANHH